MSTLNVTPSAPSDAAAVAIGTTAAAADTTPAATPAESPALEAAGSSVAAPAAAEEDHPFETDPGDHAETPAEAYEHLDLLLTRLAKRLGTTKAALRIYDPYYCEGRMVQHLARLGFESVYNRNQDFYAVKAAGECPEFDVLVTNPPFSGDHIERIFRFAIRSSKPWFLLIPQYTARKAFFLEWLNHKRLKGYPKPSFVAPTRQPYVFTAPDRADVRLMRAPGQSQDTFAAERQQERPQAQEQEQQQEGVQQQVQQQQQERVQQQVQEEEQVQEEAQAHVQDLVHKHGLEQCGGRQQVQSNQRDACAEHPAQGTAPSTPSTATPSAANAPAAEADADAEATGAGLAAAPGAAAEAVSRAAATASTAPALGQAFQVAAGSFQCVWFFNLGERHHKPVVEWWGAQRQQQQQQRGESAHGQEDLGLAYTVVASIDDVPQLMAAPKLTPAERRWRKKQQAAGGSQLAEGQPQAGEGADGRQGGRQGGGRQQQRGEGVGGRPGGRPAGRQQQQQQSGRQQQHGRQQGGLQPPQGGRPQQHHGMRAQQAGGTPSSGMGGRQGGLQPKQQQDW